MLPKTLFMPDEVYDYYRGVAVRDQAVLRTLREETATLSMGAMQISPEQGQLMQWLIRALQSKRVLEIGTFTGYSSLCMALALPADGKLIVCDKSEEWTTIAQRYWQEAGVAHKIELRLGMALDLLKDLLKTHQSYFDFAFIDANKENYDDYYEICLQLVRAGGVIAIDNVMGIGRWLASQPNPQAPGAQVIRELNAKIQQDSRVTMCMIPIGDGLTLVQKR